MRLCRKTTHERQVYMYKHNHYRLMADYICPIDNIHSLKYRLWYWPHIRDNSGFGFEQ